MKHPVLICCLLLAFPGAFARAAGGEKTAPALAPNPADALANALALAGVAPLPTYNTAIVDQLRTMPLGGGYSASHAATQRLGGSLVLNALGLDIAAARAQPSYCSGATYLVFLKAISALQRTGNISLDGPTFRALLISGQRDGEGIWGRWNANGPGTARLFYELELGRNFSDFNEARAGDFMKVFWSNAVGRKEHGHSVVFLGLTKLNGVDSVTFWSSNLGIGYGVKTVPRSKIAYAIFSRLMNPRNLARAASLTPPIDPYLASLLTKDSNFAEVRAQCGMPAETAAN